MAEQLVPPLDGVLLAKVENLGTYSANDVRFLGVPVEEANVLTSAAVDEDGSFVGKHKVVIDLDLPAQLIPSSTPGHFHLLIDKEVEWDAYRELLYALVEAGIVESGFAGASITRGYTAVRLPWIKKETQS